MEVGNARLLFFLEGGGGGCWIAGQQPPARLPWGLTTICEGRGRRGGTGKQGKREKGPRDGHAQALRERAGTEAGAHATAWVRAWVRTRGL